MLLLQREDDFQWSKLRVRDALLIPLILLSYRISTREMSHMQFSIRVCSKRAIGIANSWAGGRGCEVMCNSG